MENNNPKNMFTKENWSPELEEKYQDTMKRFTRVSDIIEIATIKNTISFLIPESKVATKCITDIDTNLKQHGY